MSADYGIEWVYGEFRISRFSSDRPSETWICPVPVNDLQTLSDVMHDATQHVDLDRGGSVAIVYEDDLHTHEFLKIPKLELKDRRKHLRRRVESSKPFAGEASWCYYLTNDTDELDGVLLHLMPKEVVEAILRICGEHFLTPYSLIPVTEIIRDRVNLSDTDRASTVLLVASFNMRTQMLVSKGDGQVMLVRELSYACTAENRQRLLLDIQRTAGYAKQTGGAAINGVWFIGELAGEIAPSLVAEIDQPIRIDDASLDPSFWMDQVANLDKRSDSNFIPARERRALNSRTLIRAGVLTTAITAVASIVVALSLEILISRQTVDSVQLEKTRLNLETERAELKSQLEQVADARVQLSQINVDAFNLPALFASHLGNLVPSGLVLTEAQVTRNLNNWEFVLRGESDHSLSESTPILQQLEDALAAPPWNATVTRSWRDGWMEQLRGGQAANAGAVGFEIRSQVK